MTWNSNCPFSTPSLQEKALDLYIYGCALNGYFELATVTGTEADAEVK
jgi:hypothetical protein